MLVAILAIIACVYVVTVYGHSADSESNKQEKTEISASFINKTVIEKMGYNGISELSGSDISGHFDIPDDTITQASVYVAESSSSSTELACFKLKEAEKSDEITTAISKHIAIKEKGFQESPKELEYIQNYVTVSTNGYVFMVISENADVAGKAFLDVVEENLDLQ